MKHFTIAAGDGLPLAVTLMIPGQPEGIVQVIHGALEHKGRYERFGRFLAEHGYIVLLSDNRGHGKSVNSAFPVGYMEGSEQLIEDQHQLTLYIKESYPNLPLTLFGHSFGSLLARNYIQKHDDELHKLILSGTVNYVKTAALGIVIGKGVAAVHGKARENRLLTKLSGMDGEDLSWISYNEENLEAIRKDELTFQVYSNQGLLTIWETVRNLKRYSKYGFKNPHLQILNVTGLDDRITGGKRGMADSLQTLKTAGYSSIKNYEYENMKHEILHEAEAEKVYADILDFLRQ